jgi:hypothetical protein
MTLVNNVNERTRAMLNKLRIREGQSDQLLYKFN